MSLHASLTRLLMLAASAGALAAAAPSAATAAQRLEQFALPSTHGNIDESTVVLNEITGLKATVMLPDGYDTQPGKAWPVLYLLQGIGDNSEGWARPDTGNVLETAKDLPAIVVMPEAGRGFFVDWWQGGARSGPRWTQYFLDDVIPTIESRYRVLPGRQNHAIGGVSMGGYGALLLGGQLPGYFGSIASLSGLVDSQSIESQLALPSTIGASYATVWGQPFGAYATVNNPIKTMANIAGSRVYLTTGNAVQDKTYPDTSKAIRAGTAIEALAFVENAHYAAMALASGNDVFFRVRTGLHAWPYWRLDLPRAINWNLFAAPRVASSETARAWTYKTMAPHGNAWGLGYRFGAPTTAITAINRAGQTLTITGSSGSITINPGAADADASGAGTKPQCSFTATIPVVRVLPAGC